MHLTFHHLGPASSSKLDSDYVLPARVTVSCPTGRTQSPIDRQADARQQASGRTDGETLSKGRGGCRTGDFTTLDRCHRSGSRSRARRRPTTSAREPAVGCATCSVQDASAQGHRPQRRSGGRMRRRGEEHRSLARGCRPRTGGCLVTLPPHPCSTAWPAPAELASRRAPHSVRPSGVKSPPVSSPGSNSGMP